MTASTDVNVDWGQPKALQINVPDLWFRLMARVGITCLLMASIGCDRSRAQGPSEIVIGPGVQQTGMKRLGINLSGQTFYDSGQMLRNLIFRNPGFEGETPGSRSCIARR